MRVLALYPGLLPGLLVTFDPLSIVHLLCSPGNTAPSLSGGAFFLNSPWMSSSCLATVLEPPQILCFHISVALAQPERGKRKLIRWALFWVTERFALKIHPIRAYLHCCLYEAASVSDNSRNTLALELAAFPKCPAGRVGQRRAAAGEKGKDTLAYLKIKISQRSLSLISTDVSSLESRQLPTYI